MGFAGNINFILNVFRGGVGRQRLECRREIAKGLDLFRRWRAIFLLRFDEIAVIIDRTTDHFIQQMIVLGRGLWGVSGDETPENGFVLGVADAGGFQSRLKLTGTSSTGGEPAWVGQVGELLRIVLVRELAQEREVFVDRLGNDVEMKALCRPRLLEQRQGYRWVRRRAILRW